MKATPSRAGVWRDPPEDSRSGPPGARADPGEAHFPLAHAHVLFAPPGAACRHVRVGPPGVLWSRRTGPGPVSCVTCTALGGRRQTLGASAFLTGNRRREKGLDFERLPNCQAPC